MTDKQIIKHKVCKFQEYWSDDVGCDGWLCLNNKSTGSWDCTYFPSETYRCKHYVEGDEYDY